MIGCGLARGTPAARSVRHSTQSDPGDEMDKKAKRKAKLKKERDYRGRVATADRFPAIYIEPGGAREGLVKAVRTAVKRIRLEHEELLPDLQLDVFHDAKERGFSAAVSRLNAAASGVPDEGP